MNAGILVPPETLNDIQRNRRTFPGYRPGLTHDDAARGLVWFNRWRHARKFARACGFTYFATANIQRAEVLRAVFNAHPRAAGCSIEMTLAGPPDLVRVEKLKEAAP